MLTIRRSEERGHADHGWLDSHHTFSFANYYDPKNMGFRSLRVLNDDRVAAGRGFGAHPHRDMEIISYVVDGRLAHRDSMGHEQEIGPNEIQYMSAGRGTVHSEFNGSKSEPVHFLQIWIEPKTAGTEPFYQQIGFEAEEKRNRWKLLASPEPAPGAVQIKQDAKVSVAELTEGSELGYALATGRHAWVHVVEGKVEVNGTVLTTGDAAAVSQEASLKLRALGPEKNEVMLFDLA
jgi:redox-sensitive bicupin YhaK (pirin superfamily)